MDLLIRYNDGTQPSCPQGVLDYLGNHLEESKEVGGLAQVNGYLSREGKVRPLFDGELWRRVGWDGRDQPSAQLIRNLSQGCNGAGSPLTRSRSLFLAPKEMLITLPVELSEALRDRPDVAHAILSVALKENLAVMQKQAVRVRAGKGRTASPDWAPAKLLTLAYIHQDNRAGEVSFHAHLIVFRPALDERGNWRAWDNGRHMARLAKPGGARERVTTAVIQETGKWGYQVILKRGRAAGAGPQGADVTTPGGRRIRPGSVTHQRRIDLLAAQEMRRSCGGSPLTPTQLELVRRESGRFPRDLRGIRRLELLERKLSALGLLDDAGRILQGGAQLAALAQMGSGMAEAQVLLESLAFPNAQEAAQVVASCRLHLAEQVPVVASDLGQARLRWVPRLDAVLKCVAATPEGLRTDGLDKLCRDDLSKLKRAGYLEGEKVHGRMVYRLAPAGRKRWEEGRKDQEDLARGIEELAVLARGWDDDPPLTLGRFASAGIDINPDLGSFAVPSAGRTHVAPELVADLGIEPWTRPIPDLDWWQRLWDRRRELPNVLRQAVLQPIEMMQRWGKSFSEVASWWKRRSAVIDETHRLKERLAFLSEEVRRLDPTQAGKTLLEPIQQLPTVRMPNGNYRGCALNAIGPDALGATLDRLEQFLRDGDAFSYGQEPESMHPLSQGRWRREAERFLDVPPMISPVFVWNPS